MRLLCLVLLACAACGKPLDADGEPAEDSADAVSSLDSEPDQVPEQPSQAGEGTAKKQARAISPRSPKSRPASPYRLLGILDPDRDQMVVFALKVPSDWQAQQSFRRQWEGGVAQNQVSLTLRSPDGRSQIEYFPAAPYVFSEGPLTNQLRSQQRSLGVPLQMAPNELAPMAPVAYIRQKLMSYLVRNGKALRNIGNEQTAPQTRAPNGQIQLRGSVDGILPNGNKARVECRIGIFTQQINGDTYHDWNVVPSLTQTAGDLEAIHTHTRVAQDSIVQNPAWVRIEQETQNRAQQANTAASTRAHEQRMNDIRRFGEANTARFNERMTQMDRNKAAFDSRMASQDRQQRIRVDTIRGESQYADPSTGERVKVEDGSNHVYRSRQDPSVYYGTDTPIDTGKVDWQELQRVQLKDY